MPCEYMHIINDKPIGIGIGLHLSDLMLGIIGSEERMQGASAPRSLPAGSD